MGSNPSIHLQFMHVAEAKGRVHRPTEGRALVAAVLLVTIGLVALAPASLALGANLSPSLPASASVTPASPAPPSPHFFPVRSPLAPASSPAASPAQTCNSQTGCGPLVYNGGPVMHNPEVVLVFWAPSGNSYETTSSDPYAIHPSDANYRSIMEGFFGNTSNSYWLGIAQQYNDSSGAPGTSVSVRSVILDTNAYPCGSCGSSSNALQDSDIQNQLQTIITADSTPTGTNVEYFVFLPLNVYECATGACSFSSFCAYHSNFLDSASNEVVYALMPDVGTDMAACSVSYDTAYPYGPNGDQVADWELNVVSHEFMESITDPEPSSGWVSASGWEIGDICAWVWTGPPSYQDRIDFLLDGHPYYLQPEWSNSANNCQQEPLGAAPQLALTVSAPASVNAGGVADIYVNATLSGASAAWGNVSVEFPANPALSTLSVVSAGTTFPKTSRVASGTSVAGCYSLCTVTTAYPIALANAGNWASGTTYRFEVAVTAPASGSIPFYVKGVVAASGSNWATDWVPTGVTQTDTLTENVTSRTISVGGGGGGGSYAVTFSETGLPTGTNWSVKVGSQTQYSTGSSIAFSEPNGTYSFTVGAAGWTPSPGSGSFTVAGAPVSRSISFTQTTYSVTFSESGLPAGTTWNVTLNSVTHSSTTSSVSFGEPNGSYSFGVAAPGYFASPATGTLSVSGGPASQAVSFTQTAFSVTFSETGLPSSTSWSVLLNSVSHSSTSRTVAFTEPNGTYAYSVPVLSAYSPSPSSGNVTVDGASVQVSVTFAPLYAVTFTETGLPASTSWSATVGGSTRTSATGSIAFSEPNGSFAYSIPSVSGYAPLPASGTLTVSGAAVSVAVVFSASYAVAFTESGLPTGTEWWVNVSGGASAHSYGTTSSVDLADGSYTYSLGSADSRYSAPGGAFTVSGGALSESVTFSLVTFPVSFTESGLPAGTSWAMAFAGRNVSSSNATLTFAEPNGSYAYSVGGLAGYTVDPASGTAVVAGAPVSVAVNFSVVQYVVTVSATGLPAGTVWWVNLTQGGRFSSAAASVTFDQPNGTYSYSVASADPTYAGAGGSFTVRGGPANVSVAFAPVTFSVTIRESGLPAGTNWSVSLGGVTRASSAEAIVFVETNGTYQYLVSGPAGYAASPRSGPLAVSGSGASLHVTFSTPSSLGLFGLPGNTGAYLLIGVVVAVVAGLAAVAFARRRSA